jgi:NTE family protein
MKKHKLGIALGGGGARGFAHLGVLKALEEKDIVPDIIAGTSAGAIVGALIADGKTPDEIYGLLKDRGFFNFSRISIPKNGMLKLDGLKKELEKHISVDDISELEIPLIVAATNMNTGKVDFFDKGPIGDIVLASSSIPVLFSPVEIDGNLYNDGGVMMNVPVEALKDKCKHIIAVNVSPVRETKKLNNLINMSIRTFQLSINSNVRDCTEDCDIMIEPEGLEDFDILNVKHAKKMFDLGYEYTRKLEIKLKRNLF